MSIKTSLPYFFAFAAAASYGCSSTTNNAGAGDGGTTMSDGGANHDGGGDDGGGVVDISGMKDIAVTVVQYATPANTPLSGVFVRASISEKGFLDTKTDDMGVAHVKVNPAKGPFDITVALAGYTAVSVLGVTDSIPGTLVVSAIGATPTFKQFAATGSIAGAAATSTLQLDAWDWQTVVTKAGATTYSTKFDVSPGLTVPMPVTAIEVNPALVAGGLNAGTAINGTITSPVVRPSAAIVIPITMPATANPPMMSTVKMNWPTTGIFTGALIKKAGAPVTDVHIGTGIVEKLTTSEAAAAMFCGIANVDPMDNTILHLQTFPGDMSPDIAGTQVSTITGTAATATDYFATVYAHDLSGTPMLAIGAVNKVSVGGTMLGDATMEVDASGYDTAEFVLSSSQGTTATAIWVIYSTNGKLAPRGLPYLPGGVMLGDLGGAVTTVKLSGTVVKYVKNAATPWQAIVQDESFLIGTAAGATLDPGGR